SGSRAGAHRGSGPRSGLISRPGRSLRKASGTCAAAGCGPWTQTSCAKKRGSQAYGSPRSKSVTKRSSNGHRRYNLLLVVARVAAVVEGADGCRVVNGSGGGVAEVVADESCV